MMTVRSVSMGLTLPAGTTSFNVDCITLDSPLARSIATVYNSDPAETSINFTFEDNGAAQVYFVFYLFSSGGAFQPVTHGPYSPSSFGTV